jgi:hypothetical protein
LLPMAVVSPPPPPPLLPPPPPPLPPRAYTTGGLSPLQSPSRRLTGPINRGTTPAGN